MILLQVVLALHSFSTTVEPTSKATPNPTPPHGPLLPLHPLRQVAFQEVDLVAVQEVD